MTNKECKKTMKKNSKNIKMKKKEIDIIYNSLV